MKCGTNDSSDFSQVGTPQKTSTSKTYLLYSEEKENAPRQE